MAEVTLKNEYLKSLPVGTHTLTFVYKDGECSTNFEVVASQNQNDANNPMETKSVIDKKDNVPKTGDNRNMVLWITLLVASELGLVVTELYGRKQKEKHYR